MLISEEHAFDELRKIAFNWGEAPLEIMRFKLDAFSEDLSPWSRIEAYNFFNKIFFEKISEVEYERIDEGFFDYLADIETSIIGFVAPECILRFNDDPTDDTDELYKYVLSNSWKNK